jgi:hypothetical protein
VKLLLAILAITWGIVSFEIGYSQGSAAKPATFDERFGKWKEIPHKPHILPRPPQALA